MQILLPSAGEAEPVVGVTVQRGVPVTVRGADVRRLIVERLAGGPDEGLAAARWKVIANQAPLLPDAGTIRGRISATAIWPTSTPSITTGTDCPGLNMMHEE